MHERVGRFSIVLTCVVGKTLEQDLTFFQRANGGPHGHLYAFVDRRHERLSRVGVSGVTPKTKDAVGADCRSTP
jgi:hypothetical protein